MSQGTRRYADSINEKYFSSKVYIVPNITCGRQQARNICLVEIDELRWTFVQRIYQHKWQSVLIL